MENIGSLRVELSKSNRGILALKAMAHQKWPESMKREERPWQKTWYEPFGDIDKASLSLRFTSHLPVHAMIPPGQWDLFKMAVELAQAGALTPLNENEREIIRAIAMESEPIFTKKA